MLLSQNDEFSDKQLVMLLGSSSSLEELGVPAGAVESLGPGWTRRLITRRDGRRSDPEVGGNILQKIA